MMYYLALKGKLCPIIYLATFIFNLRIKFLVYMYVKYI